ncbi:hypothetical protein OIU34_20210 [Pararhizobium sp. BT-229]|uniref:hypothetical protein n=1 Tax=Pararhizobium sp. BT-229 TaxID=2986923 RepID=UPI0021F7E681|nr:hypothetical protein [Pararhizobium sp. BT-229]MCV9964212.1 hypothetical protein [Pararhizobium sp. BT-229]
MDILSRLDQVARGELSPAEAVKIVREALLDEDQRAVNRAYTATRERTWLYVRQPSPLEDARLWLNAIQHLSGLLFERREVELAGRVRGMSELLLQTVRFADLKAGTEDTPPAPEPPADRRGTIADPKWLEQVNADVDYLEKMAGPATKGLYVPMDCRHLTAPPGCVDFAVVSADEGREVSRVWMEDDARFQAAASPARISRLVSAYRQLQTENATLKATGSGEGSRWIASLLRDAADRTESRASNE